MAGAGYKLFNTGDVLTAAQVNTYLQEQVVMVFASAAARTTALSGVLAEGMVSYLKDTDALEIYSGSAWVGYGSGDITAVVAGTGLSGGATSGSATLSLTTPVVETNGGTNQTTYATGDLLYASAANTLAKRTIGTTGQVLTVSGGVPTWATAASGSTFSGCQLYKTSSQSVSDNTNTTISFEAEFFDSDNYHDNSTNNSRITVPSGKAGKYFVFASLGMDPNTTGRRLVYIFKNGATYSNGIENALPPISGNNGSTLTMGIVDLAVGDYVTAVFYQNSGGSLNVTSTSGSGYTRFGAFLIGA